ncbi:MAG TPA: S1 RNA-binding domain-containing protein, partial [Bacillota bacterium]|nr:S1 RNA-binding domain-containing protein [Bacillota bacterium]
EIHVDLGTKHTGIMPYDEAVTDSSVELEKEFHVGDKVDVVIVKFNDSEGTVLVSKKRFDADKNWNSIQEAGTSNEILTGKVKEAVKGGLIVNYSGLRVFVPASQSGLPRDADLNELVGKEVSFRIIETDPYKKRVIASIRSAKRSLQKQQSAQFYETAQPGDKIHGTVRSLTSFGAFVDLGGVDGMIHITELSWGRLRNPADVLSVGDEVDVYIKDIDKEKKRISLGYKTEETNPWNLFIKKYNVGDVVTVKIASILTFGAFGTIIDGVDGLIHISQIALEPVQNIKSVFKIGDEVDVKITGINEETHKINLSRRAMLADLEDGVVDEPINASEETTTEGTENN